MHVKPQPVKMPTDINEYHNISDLPDQWRYAVNEKGQVYYYHTKILIPQWEKPVKFLPLMEEQRINDIDIKVETNGKHRSVCMKRIIIIIDNNGILNMSNGCCLFS